MIQNTEIDFVVKDSLEAIKEYKTIFDAKVIEQTNFDRGLNEVIFKIGDSSFHMLDENPEYGLNAPVSEYPQSFWFNVTVSDIEETWNKALEANAAEIQPITHMEEMGVSNALFLDNSGYTWMLHEVHKEVSFEEREEFFKEKFDQ